MPKRSEKLAMEDEDLDEIDHRARRGAHFLRRGGSGEGGRDTLENPSGPATGPLHSLFPLLQ